MKYNHYSIVAAPNGMPVSYDEAASHLRVDSDVDREYIIGLISAATEYVERVTGRATTKKQYKLVSSAWRYIADPNEAQKYVAALTDYQYPVFITRYMPLFRVPLVTIDNVEYYAVNATTPTTFNAENYAASLNTEPGALYVPGDLPDVDEYRPDSIQITFTAGTDKASVSPLLRHAIKLLVSHFYENRNHFVIDRGIQAVNVPTSFDTLIVNQRVGGYFA